MFNFRNRFNIDIYSRSKYFSNLERRSQKTESKVEDEKVDSIINEILGKNKIFSRDYAVFSYHYPAPLSLSPNKNIHINPNIKIKIQSPSEKSNPLKYKKKEIETDPFSNMFTNRNPKLNNNSRFTLKKPNNKKNRLYFSENMDSDHILINCIKNFKISNYKIVN